MKNIWGSRLKPLRGIFGSTTAMQCEIRNLGDVTVFVMRGNLMHSRIKDVRKIIMDEMAQSSTNKFIVDLGGTDMIDSSGLGFIVSVYKAAVSRKGAFSISRPNETVGRTFQTLGLTRFFKMHETEDQAIEAIREVLA